MMFLSNLIADKRPTAAATRITVLSESSSSTSLHRRASSPEASLHSPKSFPFADMFSKVLWRRSSAPKVDPPHIGQATVSTVETTLAPALTLSMETESIIPTSPSHQNDPHLFNDKAVKRRSFFSLPRKIKFPHPNSSLEQPSTPSGVLQISLPEQKNDPAQASEVHDEPTASHTMPRLSAAVRESVPSAAAATPKPKKSLRQHIMKGMRILVPWKNKRKPIVRDAGIQVSLPVAESPRNSGICACGQENPSLSMEPQTSHRPTPERRQIEHEHSSRVNAQVSLQEVEPSVQSNVSSVVGVNAPSNLPHTDLPADVSEHRHMKRTDDRASIAHVLNGQDRNPGEPLHNLETRDELTSGTSPKFALVPGILQTEPVTLESDQNLYKPKGHDVVSCPPSLICDSNDPLKKEGSADTVDASNDGHILNIPPLATAQKGFIPHSTRSPRHDLDSDSSEYLFDYPCNAPYARSKLGQDRFKGKQLARVSDSKAYGRFDVCQTNEEMKTHGDETLCRGEEKGAGKAAFLVPHVHHTEYDGSQRESIGPHARAVEEEWIAGNPRQERLTQWERDRRRNLFGSSSEDASSLDADDDESDKENMDIQLDEAQTPPEDPKVIELAIKRMRVHDMLNVMSHTCTDPVPANLFRFENFIGDGTYGFVLAAFAIEHQIKVAAKFILKRRLNHDMWIDDPTLGTVPYEYYVLRRLNHPGIIPVFAHYEDERYFVIISQLHGTPWCSDNPLLQSEKHFPRLRTDRNGYYGKVEPETSINEIEDPNDPETSLTHGMSSEEKRIVRERPRCDLFECIDCHDGLGEALIRRIFYQVAAAISYLHNAGWVHRDLKDENIVIDENYDVKLVDFGSAAHIPSREEDFFTQFMGTMDFAAPENVRRERYQGPQSEIWALGVVLYVLNFHKLPFEQPSETYTKRPHYPPETDFLLVNLMDGMMDVDVNSRFTINDVVNHPWLRNGPSNTPHKDNHIVPKKVPQRFPTGRHARGKNGPRKSRGRGNGFRANNRPVRASGGH